MRRDDPTPAPWTKAGGKRIKELGLTMQVSALINLDVFSCELTSCNAGYIFFFIVLVGLITLILFMCILGLFQQAFIVGKYIPNL